MFCVPGDMSQLLAAEDITGLSLNFPYSFVTHSSIFLRGVQVMFQHNHLKRELLFQRMEMVVI